MAAFTSPVSVSSSLKSFAGNEVRGFFAPAQTRPQISIQNHNNITMAAAPRLNARRLQVKVVYPTKKSGSIRTQSEATFSECLYTTTVNVQDWFNYQQTIQKTGGKILSVKLASGVNKWNVGQSGVGISA